MNMRELDRQALNALQRAGQNRERTVGTAEEAASLLQAAQSVRDMTGQLTTPADVTRYMTAGNATFTLRSQRTGTRFTYNVHRKEEEGRPPVTFVSLLTGADNETDFRYLGMLISGENANETNHFTLRLTRKSLVSNEAPSVLAFRYLLKSLNDAMLPPSLEVWHTGRCGRCGRKLTVPESVASGIGPVCEGREG